MDNSISRLSRNKETKKKNKKKTGKKKVTNKNVLLKGSKSSSSSSSKTKKTKQIKKTIKIIKTDKLKKEVDELDKEEYKEEYKEDKENDDELENINDEELDKLFEDFSSIEEDLYNTKKVNQYKVFLEELRSRLFKLSHSDKYDEAIREITNEIKKVKVDERYLKNELLRISDDLKYDYYEKSNKGKKKESSLELNYPSYYDPNFGQKIFKKAEFYQNKLDVVKPSDIDNIVNARLQGDITLAKHQRFLKNFMSNNTPYNGVLIFHGLGVGKTCASIAIAEALRPSVKENHQKIIIIAKSNFDKGEIFNLDRLKKNQNQCAGDTFISEFNNPEMVKRCQEGHEDSCKIIKNKVDKMIKNSYSFFGALEWAKHVVTDLQKAIRGVPESKHEETKIARIKKMYSNTVMIIDEAHNIKEAGEKKSRFVPPILMKVLEHAVNLKLVLLTGTPMFNESSDLISIMNYLLINDKRPVLREGDVFKPDGSFTKNGKETLERYTRGYVSYVRSENPINYPLRFSSSINDDNDLVSPQKYPTKDIFGKPLNEHIKYIDIVSCPMNKEQEKVYETYLAKRTSPDEDKTSAAYSSELQILNYVYQGLDKTDNLAECYGEKGLFSVMTKLQGKQQYEFNNPDDALELKGDKLANHSSKIYKIMKNIEKTDGIVFIYTEYENAGILPMAFALELAGYKKYKSSDMPVLISDHKERKYKGDYLIISGNANLSKYYEYYLAKRHDMMNEPVKVILATRKASEGINLFGVREIHVLNPWHNLNRIAQAIGRGLRSWSHIELPKEKRNITVYLYAATLKDRETVDLKIYREAEKKAIFIGQAEDVLKRNAIDCELNKGGNQYSAQEWGDKVTVKTSRGDTKKVSVYDKPFTHICHYLGDCDYKCYNPPTKTELKDDELDYSTFDLGSLKYETNELIKIIGKVYRNDVILSLDGILKKLPAKYKDNIKLIYEALNEMITKKSEVFDKFGRSGYLIYRGNYYIFQPSDINNEGLSIYQRSIPPPIRPNMVDLSEYVVKFGEEKKKLMKKDQYHIQEVIEHIHNSFENIKSKDINDIFTTSFDLTDEEIYRIVVDRLIVPFKRVVLNNLITKSIKGGKMNLEEETVMKCLENNIIRKGFLEHTSNKTIIGYRLIENEQQTFYKMIKSDTDIISFEQDVNLQIQFNDMLKIKQAQRKDKDEPNLLYGYLKFDKIDQPPQFKIKDLTKGDKKAIKGITCSYKSRNEIYDHLVTLYPKTKEKNNKKMMCDDIEVILRRNDIARKDGKRWFFSVEETKELEGVDS